MKYRYYTCDVFTDSRFGGNQLAVLPDAVGLSDRQMQQIAREFNYSETTFVFPPEAGHTRRVRIFTPAQEMPFAGHPNVGTAYVLASTGALGPIGSSLDITFEEGAGPVAITVHATNGRVTSCELKAPRPVSFGETIPARLVASAVSLAESDIVTSTHEPRVVSVGLPFVITEVRDVATLARPRIHTAGFEAVRDHVGDVLKASLYLYARTGDGEIRVRMFAPLTGITEDAATGSGGCAVAALLAHHHAPATGESRYVITQGVEMGRPSRLLARAARVNGSVTTTWIGGGTVPVSEGFIEID